MGTIQAASGDPFRRAVANCLADAKASVKVLQKREAELLARDGDAEVPGVE